VLRAALQAWQAAGVPPSTAALHARTLRAALGWAFDERLIASQPLQGMRGPGQPEPRRDVPLHVVRALLNAAQAEVEQAKVEQAEVEQAKVEQAKVEQAKVEQARGPGRSAHRRHRAEQVLLLLRLAADSGARRGELAALKRADLHGRVLHVDRGVSAQVVTTTKTGRSRRITLGAGTARSCQDSAQSWQDQLRPGQPLGPWLFCAAPGHQQRLGAGTLGHWFTAFVRRHGHGDVCLHRLPAHRRDRPGQPRTTPASPTTTRPRRSQHHPAAVLPRPPAARPRRRRPPRTTPWRLN